MSQDDSRIGKLILVPAVITLAVTLLRLVGELQGWSPTLFNRGDKPFSPSLVGIVWLVPVFGAWFGWKLTRAGSGPGSLGRAFGLTLASRLCYLSSHSSHPKQASCRSACGDPTCRSLRASRSCRYSSPSQSSVSRSASWPGQRSAAPFSPTAWPRASRSRCSCSWRCWATGAPTTTPGRRTPDQHARVVGRDRAGAAVLLLDLDHDRVRCAVRNRRSGDRAAAGNGSRLDGRTRRARGDVASGRAHCHPRPDLPGVVSVWRTRAPSASRPRCGNRT